MDPYANTENNSNENKEDELERLKFDIQQLYTSSTVALPTAVEHLEIEVRQEILQHQLEPTISPEIPIPSKEMVEEETLPPSTPPDSPSHQILHSVDSIVNASNVSDVEVREREMN